MPDTRTAHRHSFVNRAARVAFTFVMMNCSAVMGVFAVVARRKVWR